MKIKFNWPFFLMTIVLPFIGGCGGMILTWNIIISPYPSVIFGSPLLSIISGFVFLYLLTLAIVSYLGIPYMIMIKKDGIHFYRLKKQFKASFKDIERIRVIRRNPIKKYGIGSIDFFFNGEEARAIVFISNTIINYIISAMGKSGIAIEERSIKDMSREELEYEKNIKF